MWWIFLSIYCLSVVLSWCMIYDDIRHDNEYTWTFGDAIRRSRAFVYIPIFNTLIIVIWLICAIIESIRQRRLWRS